MRTVRAHTRVACLVGAMALLFHIAPAMAGGRDDHNRPVEVTFAKWFISPTLLEGNWGGDLANKFAGELLRRQASVNPALNTVAVLEAVYQLQHGGDFFTALIHGGSNSVTGAGKLDGVILAGWRTGASVHVEFDRIPGVPGTIGCPGAPAGATCFAGTIRIERAPRD